MENKKQKQMSPPLRKNQPKQEESLGVDLDEQEMNGLYGMLETKTEN